MAFSQTTASTIDDVIGAICNYAIANAGFSDAGTTVVNTVTHRRISKGGIFWTFWKDGTSAATRYRIGCRMSYSVAANVEPTNLNGQFERSFCSFYNFPGPFPNVYLFSEGTCVHCVIEVTTGVFTHISIGQITKTETFVGGEYVSCMYQDYRAGTPLRYSFGPNGSNGTLFQGDGARNTSYGSTTYGSGAIRDLAGKSAYNDYKDFTPIGGSNQYTADLRACTGSAMRGPTSEIFRDAPNIATLRSPVFPMYIFLRDPTSGLKRMSGYVPNIRLCPMEYLDNGETILNDWQVFPMTAKESDLLYYPASGNWAFAYRKV